MAEKKPEMLKVWDQMEKLYGNKGYGKLGPIEVLCSTGSYALDEASGIWGIPKGRVVQYAGYYSCGKTMMSLIAISEWQKLSPENWAIFIDAEGTLNKEWAEMLGVDLSRLFIIDTNDGVEIWTQLCGVPSREIGKPKSKPGILDLEKDNPTGLGLIILDSIAAITTPIEMTKQVGNTNIAPMGRFMPDALKRLTPLLGQTGVTLIAINQVRIDVGKMWGDPETTPGGRSWKHAQTLMIHFIASESKKSHFIDENTGKKVGHICTARIDKNKISFSGGTCNLELMYVEGIVNKHKEIGELAIMYNVVDRPNNRTYIYKNNRWVGKDNFISALLDKKLADEMLEEVKESKKKGIKPKRSDLEDSIIEISEIQEEEE